MTKRLIENWWIQRTFSSLINYKTEPTLFLKLSYVVVSIKKVKSNEKEIFWLKLTWNASVENIFLFD